MTAHAFQFAAGCMIGAIGLLLIGSACHGYVEAALSWLRSLPSRLPAFRSHGGRHVPGSSPAGDHLYLPVPAAQATLAEFFSCCECCNGCGEDHEERCEGGCNDAPTSAETAAHADAMHELAVPFLPPSPQDTHPYPPYVPAWRAIERMPTEDHAPWTGSQPVLTPEAEAELDRQRYIRARLDECGADVSPDDVRAVLDSLRQPVYGEVPVLAVDEAQRLADRMLT